MVSAPHSLLGYSRLCCAALGPIVVERCLTQGSGQCLLRLDFGPIHHHFWCILLTRTSHRFCLNSTGEETDSTPPWENWGIGNETHKASASIFCCSLHPHCTAASITMFSLQCCEKPWHTHYYSVINLCVYTLEYDMSPTGSCLNTCFPALSTILKIAVPGWWRCVPGNGPLRAIEQLFLVLSWHVSRIPMRCPQSQIQPHQPQWRTVFPEPRIRTTSSSSKLFLSGILTQQTWKATDKYTVDKGVSAPIWMEEPCFVDHCILWALSTKSDSYILLRARLLLTENKWMTFATQGCLLE